MITNNRVNDAIGTVPVIPITLPKLDSVAGDGVAVFCWADVRPLAGVAGYIDWRVCGGVSHVLQSGFFRGELDEVLMLPVRGRFGPKRLFLFGLGARDAWHAISIPDLCQKAVTVMRRAGVPYWVLAAPADRHAPTREAEFARVASSLLPASNACVLIEYKKTHLA